MTERLPTDLVWVAVYDRLTGHIKQVTQTSVCDMHLQHLVHDGHDYVEVDRNTSPHEHQIDVKTGTVAPRTSPTDGQRSHKAREIHEHARLAMEPGEDLTTLLLRAAGGDVAAQKRCRALADTRDAVMKHRDNLVGAVANAKRATDLDGLSWSVPPSTS